MADISLNIINQVRRGTAEEWISSSYALKSGELGFDTTNKIFKVGDGSTLWAALEIPNKAALEAAFGSSFIKAVVEGDNNGEIKVDGVAVKVHGLGTAAYKNEADFATAAQGAKAESAVQKVTVAGVEATGTNGEVSISKDALNTALGFDPDDYATAEQGDKADTALQKADITEGTANGTIKVKDTDVKVKGLNDAAYATVESLNATAKGYADAVDSKVTSLTTKVGTLETNYDTLNGTVESLSSDVEDLTSQISGLTGAMHFKGKLDSLPANTNSYTDGDVIIVGQKEYVCSGSEWVEFGDEGSYLLKTEASSTYATKTELGTETSARETLAGRVTAAEGEIDEIQSTLETLDTTYAKASDSNTLKGRVDTAEGNITALQEADEKNVKTEGDQTVAGVKTFSSIPVLPASDPTTDNQAARKVYVDSKVRTVSDSVSTLDGKVTTLEGKVNAIDVSGDIEEALAELTVNDTAVAGQYVKAVKQENGKITVERDVLPTAPEATVKDVVASEENDAGVTVTKSAGTYTVGHKKYDTAPIPTADTTPVTSYITGMTVENGHVTKVTATSLEAGLTALTNTFILDGGKADGNW